MRRRKQLGELGLLDAGRQTLEQLAADWWTLHAHVNLAPKTRLIYSGVWERRLAPALGKLPLIEITPDVIEGFVAELRQDGVGEATITKCLVVLRSMMNRAVAWRRLQTNPVTAIVRRPSSPRRTVHPLAPSGVEGLRAQMNIRDATLVSVLAYAGLRPGEALGLQWADVRERTIVVERAVSLGEVKTTKTRCNRTVEMVSPLVADLARWRIASGRPDGARLVFPRDDGSPWTEQDWKNWRRRVFRSAATGIGRPKMRPYDLRHSFCSLLLAEGRSVFHVAQQAGHSPAMTLSTYGHVLDELEAGRTASAEAEIRRAREGHGGCEGCMPDVDPSWMIERLDSLEKEPRGDGAVPLMYPGAFGRGYGQPQT